MKENICIKIKIIGFITKEARDVLVKTKGDL